MPEDQNQNNPFNNQTQHDMGQPDQQSFSVDPNQQYVDPAYSTNQAYGTAYDPQTVAGQNQFTQFDATQNQPQGQPFAGDFSTPAATPVENASFDTGFASFDQQPGEATTVPPLDQQFPAPQPTPNTFEQKKTGSRVFLIGSIVVVVILLIAMGVLSYFNFFAPKSNNNANTDQVAQQDTNNNTDNQNQNNNNTDDKEEEQPVTVDEGSTGGSNTPASQSRVNSDTTIAKEWLIQNFVRPEIDTEGNCLNLNVCGNQADPDNDGASNIVEYNFGADPLEPDTDSDLLADGDELFVYFTSPTKDKSDTDTFGDGTEITGCYDPISAASSKMTNQRRSQVASNVTLKPLHEPTVTLLKNASATQSDIINRAIPLSACPTENTAPTTNGGTTTTPTNTTNTTNTTTKPQTTSGV